MQPRGDGGRDLMPTAFDEIRPPSSDVIADCVHCGFCLPTCPTYSLWDEEMDSPRGRIVLMNAGLEEGSDLSRTLVTHIDRCLGCMACVTACPSGVRYDQLIEDTRSQIERNFDRSPWERLVRSAIFATFPHPNRMRALAPLIAAGHALGLARAVRRRRGGPLGRVPPPRTLLEGSPPRSPRPPPPSLAPPPRKRRGRG